MDRAEWAEGRVCREVGRVGGAVCGRVREENGRAGRGRGGGVGLRGGGGGGGGLCVEGWGRLTRARANSEGGGLRVDGWGV